MLNLGTDELAKYPFLAEAGQYLKDKGFTLDQFGNDPDLKPIIEKAYNRIELASSGKIYRSELASTEALDLEVFSFLIAIILLKLCGMHTLIKRFSLAEARRAEKFLEKDLANFTDETKNELATKIIKDLFSVNVQKQNDNLIYPNPIQNNQALKLKHPNEILRLTIINSRVKTILVSEKSEIDISNNLAKDVAADWGRGRLK